MIETLLKEGINIERADDIYSVKNLVPGVYDRKAILYDKLIKNPLYNRIMWGNKPGNYTRFARESIMSTDKGTVIDVGCGTLGFTGDVYRDYNRRKLVLIDLSEEMLKIGRARISNGSRSIHQFLRADALALPFSAASIQTVLSFGIFHVFHDPTRLIREFYRVLVPGGDLHLTSLCTDRKWSARYLRLLENKGEVGSVLSANEIADIVCGEGFKVKKKVIGGMVFIDGVKEQ
ncbi:MAG: class I SAM-dependent methyltransferase [Cyclobacteriaceae bacterium]|nr:class I SAM-dependent methyltransferase [Cyclobacteriaceae bacterium]